MRTIYYDNRDLSGIATAAVLSQKFPAYNIQAYHHGDTINLGKHPDEDIIIVGVGIPVDDIFYVAKECKSLTIYSHTKEHYELINYAFKNEVDTYQSEITGLINHVEFPEFNMNLYYSDTLCSCEMVYFFHPFGNSETKDRVRMVGQYIKNRKGEKSMASDFPFRGVEKFAHWAMTCPAVVDMALMLYSHPTTEAMVLGSKVMDYQMAQNRRLLAKHFVFNLAGLRILACNGVPHLPSSFEHLYHEECHDAAMAFNFNGFSGKWEFTVFADNADLAPLAEMFSSSVIEKTVCFEVPGEDVRLTKNGIEFGKPIVIDIAALPTDFDTSALDNFIAGIEPVMTIPTPFDVKIVPLTEDDKNFQAFNDHLELNMRFPDVAEPEVKKVKAATANSIKSKVKAKGPKTKK